MRLNGIDDKVRAGQKVYDLGGAMVGTIQRVDVRRRTMRVATNPFRERELDIAFALIQWVNSHELVLKCPLEDISQRTPKDGQTQ